MDDVTDRQQLHNPYYLPYLVDHLTAYLLKLKYLRNIVTPQKPRGGVATNPPFSYTTVGEKLACTSEGYNLKSINMVLTFESVDEILKCHHSNEIC